MSTHIQDRPDLLLRFVAASVFVVLASDTARAQTVSVGEDGNVYWRARDGAARRQLTTSGYDTSAVLSPDGRWVAFVRRLPGHRIDTGQGDVEAAELWIMRVNGTGTRRLVRSRAAREVARQVADVRVPQFSPDGRRLYFETTAFAVSDAIHMVDIATARERYLCGGDGLVVVPRGQYAGHLLISQHRYFLIPGSFDRLYLMTPTCREVGPVAEDSREGAVAEFFEQYVPDVSARPTTPDIHRPDT